ncbi:MAG: hypothetical protein MPW16_01480 [Candidatus Manganitrophus sp.]|nr:MAG: hypothetical protein MPW16_01480 [Candidatus Manganitrophus sp.]
MNTVKRILFIATLLLLLLPGTRSFAQEMEAERWEYTIVPYLWLPNINGNVTLGRQSGSVDVGVDALLDQTEYAGMIQLEARKVEISASLPSLTISGWRRSQQILQTDVGLTMDFWMIEFGGFFRSATWGSTGTSPAAYVDLLLGGRYWGISRETEFLLSPGGYQRKRRETSTSPSHSWGCASRPT